MEGAERAEPNGWNRMSGIGWTDVERKLTNIRQTTTATADNVTTITLDMSSIVMACKRKK
jgi:hypothetical protein